MTSCQCIAVLHVLLHWSFSACGLSTRGKSKSPGVLATPTVAGSPGVDYHMTLRFEFARCKGLVDLPRGIVKLPRFRGTLSENFHGHISVDSMAIGLSINCLHTSISDYRKWIFPLMRYPRTLLSSFPTHSSCLTVRFDRQLTRLRLRNIYSKSSFTSTDP